jgi:hypothetical protein
MENDDMLHRREPVFLKTTRIGSMLFGETTDPVFPGVNDTDTPPPEPPFRINAVSATLAQAHAQMPFTFALPTWLPPGFTLDDEVRVTVPPHTFVDERGTTHVLRMSSSMASVHVTWQHPDGRFLGLGIREDAPAKVTVPVAPDGVTELQVHEQPAALITGHYAFDPDTGEVFVGEVHELWWQRNGLHYTLRFEANTIPTDELLRTAHSIMP